jgi:hypothetical protein
MHSFENQFSTFKIKQNMSFLTSVIDQWMFSYDTSLVKKQF